MVIFSCLNPNPLHLLILGLSMWPLHLTKCKWTEPHALDVVINHHGDSHYKAQHSMWYQTHSHLEKYRTEHFDNLNIWDPNMQSIAIIYNLLVKFYTMMISYMMGRKHQMSYVFNVIPVEKLVYTRSKTLRIVIQMSNNDILHDQLHKVLCSPKIQKFSLPETSI